HHHPRLHSFPTRRSFRSKMFPKTHLAAAIFAGAVVGTAMMLSPSADVEAKRMSVSLDLNQQESGKPVTDTQQPAIAMISPAGEADRKSTRLNSSHVKISY